MAEKKGFIGEFREFVTKGNVLDLAVGVIIGGAFGTITKSLTDDIIMPIVSLFLGGIDFNEWKIVLKEAVLNADGTEAAAAVTVNYGTFISTIINFLILALVIFCMVKAVNNARARAEAAKAAAEPAPEPKPEPEPEEPKPTAEELLTDILAELKKGK